MKLKVFTLILVSALAQGAFADDMESMFDSASAKPGETVKVRAEVRQNNALSDLLQSLLKKPTPDQSLLMRDVEAEDWQKTLIQYPVAFEHSAFQKTANGRALFALAHFKAGLPVTGLELLFKIEKPSQIHPELRRLWKEAAPEQHYAWDLARIQWNPGFTNIFPANVEYRIEARGLTAKSDLSTLKKMFAGIPSNSPERAKVGWQLAIAEAADDQVEPAAKVLAQLMKALPTPVSVDLMNLTAARLLYQRGHFAAAIKYDEKVASTSEYWTDAQEEMAWAYIRKGEPQNAIAMSRSLMVPSLASQVSAESSFVHSLGQLKICDYAGVLTTLTDFPKRFKERSQDLANLGASAENPVVGRVITLLKDHRVTTAELKSDAKLLPRRIARDERLFEMAQDAKFLENEAKAADDVYIHTMSSTGLQGYFALLKKGTLNRAHRALADAENRVKQMALVENSEIKNILRKLHIVEAEVIQQMSLSGKAIAVKGKGNTGAKATDAMKFPAEKEVWFDEIGNYRVDVQRGCHAKGNGGGKGKGDTST